MTRRGAVVAALIGLAGKLVGQNYRSIGKPEGWISLTIPDGNYDGSEGCKEVEGITTVCPYKESYSYALVVSYAGRTVRLTADEVMDALEGISASADFPRSLKGVSR